MSTTLGIRMKNPTHPGGFVKSEIIEPLGLSVTDAALALGVTPACALGAAERASAPLTRNGAADRKGFRSFDGHADANAEQL